MRNVGQLDLALFHKRLRIFVTARRRNWQFLYVLAWFSLKDLHHGSSRVVETFNNRPLADSQAIDDAVDGWSKHGCNFWAARNLWRHGDKTYLSNFLQLKRNNMNFFRTLLCRVWRCGCLVVSREDVWMFAQIKPKNTSVLLSSDYDHHQSHGNRRCHFHGDHPHHEKTCCWDFLFPLTNVF